MKQRHINLPMIISIKNMTIPTIFCGQKRSNSTYLAIAIPVLYLEGLLKDVYDPRDTKPTLMHGGGSIMLWVVFHLWT